MSRTTLSLLGAVVALALLAPSAGQATQVPPPQKKEQAFTKASQATADGLGAISSALNGAGSTIGAGADLMERNSEKLAAGARTLAAVSVDPARKTALGVHADELLRAGARGADDLRDLGGAVNGPGRLVSLASHAATGATIAGQLAEGEYGAAATTGAQALTDEVVSKAGSSAARSGCSSVGGPLVGAGCGAAFEAGFAAGSLVKKFDTCAVRDCGPGKSYTIEDGVTDAYYAAYERVTFLQDPSKDPMSDEFAAKVRAQVEENKRRYAERSAELRAQQDEIERTRATLAAAQVPAPNAGAAGSDGGVATFVSALMDGIGIYQQLQGTPTPIVPGPAAADPTGCHPGHDEQAHPGGCHDGNGTLQ